MSDVEELICELHHIAGSEQHDPDIRRTACDAESALASLREWVNELQMNVAERQAVEEAIEDFDGRDNLIYRQMAANLRGLLGRHRALHNT